MMIDEGDYGERLHTSFLFPTHRLSRSQVNGADDSAILASFLLDEKLGRLGVCGCACCIVSPLPPFLPYHHTEPAQSGTS